MKKLGLLSIVAFIILFSGCSNRYEVTFDSNPRGATLICDGRNWGYTPKLLALPIEAVKDRSHLDISGCSANWVSGYSEKYTTKMTIYSTGSTIVTLNRPKGEGYQVDAQFALQVEQMKAQQAQADAAQQQANQQALQNMNQSIQNMNNNMQMQQHNYQMQNLNNNLNNINRNLNINNGGYYNGGGYYNNR